MAFPTLMLWGTALWVAATRYWPVLPMLLSVLPVLLSVWIVAGCRRAFPAQACVSVRRGGLSFLVAGLGLLLIPGGLYALHFARALGPPTCFALALLLALVHLGFALLLFRGYERKLILYRRTDVALAAD